VGAFKLRGALVYLDWLKQTELEFEGWCGDAGILAKSDDGRAAQWSQGGDLIHGQQQREESCHAGAGAELVEHGQDFQESLEFARLLARDKDFICRIVPRTVGHGTATMRWSCLRARPHGRRLCAHRHGIVDRGMAAARNALE